MAAPLMRVVLASKSEARQQVLETAGIRADVIPSGFDESAIQDPVGTSLCARLAEAKGAQVAEQLPDRDVIVLACDTVLEFEGKVHGKPRTERASVALWRRMRGHTAIIHTGHYVMVRRDGDSQAQVQVRSTTVNFADISDDEAIAYAATGEPINAAGAFSINKLGGAFVTSIIGDPYNVVGISLPLVRQMVIDMGVGWHTLWDR
ncbi:Maf family protein [Tessaracoccus oleiagri]|nr:nucleoside triphosphate pyrophosphatase [Tessaracoccus oleiagri]